MHGFRDRDISFRAVSERKKQGFVRDLTENAIFHMLSALKQLNVTRSGAWSASVRRSARSPCYTPGLSEPFRTLAEALSHGTLKTSLRSYVSPGATAVVTTQEKGSVPLTPLTQDGRGQHLFDPYGYAY